MPTPVSSARQCLAGEAARALDDAVAVARRRAHAQTTSLHVVSALLASSSTLRDALGRARTAAACSPRLQFRALELCFGVALDRLPSAAHHPDRSSSPPDEPPVSNSLMAAIKRSQASQRRNPDTFHLYQQQQQQQGFAGVKVELQQLLLAILDDPVVSRVFADAGYRSCDIKLAILRPPPPPMLRLPRGARCPPVFLCNLPPPAEKLAFTFPDAGEESCRRVGDILARKTAGRNPVLVGVGAAEAAKDFALAVERRNWALLPSELHGVKLVSIESELTDGSWTPGRLEDVGRRAEEPGVIVSLGDLKGLMEMGGSEQVVTELTSLLERHSGRVWVMGWSATYETYMTLLSRYPSLDKDWDLQLLPISSARASSTGLLSRPHSFMDSFVPFGGFFPTAYESKYLLNSPPKVPRCQHCNDKYEQELAVILKGSSAPVDNVHQPNFPSWLRSSEIGNMNAGLDAAKAPDDSSVLSTRVMDLQKKWNDICQRGHRHFKMFDTDNQPVVPHIVGLSYVSDKVGSGNQHYTSPDLNQNQSLWENQLPVSVGLQISSIRQSISLPTAFELKDKTFSSKLQVRPSRSEQLQREEFGSHTTALSEGLPDGGASPSSVTSVTTDLVLGTPHGTPSKEEKSVSKIQNEHLPCKNTIESRSIPDVLIKSYSFSGLPDSLVKSTCHPTRNLLDLKDKSGGVSTFGHRSKSPNMCKEFDPRDFKTFFRSLMDKVGRQEEAIFTMSQAIVRCKSGHERRHGASFRGDIWLHFHGPDMLGKRRIARTLAELVYGSNENFVCMDVSFQDVNTLPNTICDQREINDYDVRLRGKTFTDRIAEEVSKKPWSVVFLENVDKVDLLVQNSLSQAIETGKFSDSGGRAFSINNNIFVTTSMVDQRWTSSSRKGSVSFSEDQILTAQKWQMKVTIEPSYVVCGKTSAKVLITSRKGAGNRQAFQSTVFAGKRKSDGSADCIEDHESFGASKRTHKAVNTFLDLNLPVEELTRNDTDSGNTDETHCISDTSEAWLEEFLKSVDETVNFKPFDFDALADNLVHEISRIFRNTIGSECILEIDVKVMEQILAATWLLEGRDALNNWLSQVLRRSFIEVGQRCNLSAHTVLRLATCEDALMEEQAPGILLPSRVVLE